MNTAGQRFESKWVENENGCHVWTASKDGKGYGQFRDEGILVGAHRFAWARRNGQIPPGMHIDHYRMNRPETRDQCSRACVNPDHMELVTSAENSRRSQFNIERCRDRGRKTGRKNGLGNRKHPLPEGVTPNRKRFAARIWDPVARKFRYLGTFDAPEEAHQRYLLARAGYVYAQYIRLPGMSEVEHAS